jgi:uncharacterized membrane protein YjjP (DUF1212 family)
MDELANSNCSAAGLDQVEVFVVTTARAASTNNARVMRAARRIKHKNEVPYLSWSLKQ